MKAVIQRVSEASVTVDRHKTANIGSGLLILLGIEEADSAGDIAWLTQKIANLRIFADSDGVMNLSIKETGGEIMVVSQFTLHASTKKGNRPSYVKAAKPELAVLLYNQFVETLGQLSENKIQTGIFGADMKVALVNDGPVTIIIDTKNRE